MSNVHMNLVTWSLALLPENATKIDQINQIILGSSSSANAPIEKAKNEVEKKTSSTKEESTETASITLKAFQTAAKLAKKENDEAFVNSVLENFGEEIKTTLGRSISAVAVENYEAIIAEWVTGPQTEQASDELEDDGFGEDDDLGDDVPEVSAVKAALKAFAKETGREEAKAIMNKHGAEKLQNVDDCTDKQLIAMFAELV